jgi:thiamine-monophosphate kinase
MNLSALGEDALVKQIIHSLPTNDSVLVGAGDDCAVVRTPSADFWTLLKTDCVVEGVHFTGGTDFQRVGWKALARAVSDIAAMGGIPQHALVTVVLPPSLEVAKVAALYAGLNQCAERYGVAIVGGETARSPHAADGKPGPVFISIALTGTVEPARCVLRSGGKPGDALFVTGRLGGSITGKHLDFTPRLHEARWLTEHFTIRAMMDLSDGVGADLPRLAAASGCGFHLDLAALPCTEGCTPEQALADGEDFELLFAIAPEDAPRLLSEWPFPAALPLTQIGHLTTAAQSPTNAPSTLHGFDHFA